ncbi:hypothetical protein NC77_17820 [Janthinobacterium lividum]|nr:hypothetical protein NC77_17820 [Janthinobacterium lividum]
MFENRREFITDCIGLFDIVKNDVVRGQLFIKSEISRRTSRGNSKAIHYVLPSNTPKKIQFEFDVREALALIVRKLRQFGAFVRGGNLHLASIVQDRARVKQKKSVDLIKMIRYHAHQ